MSLRQNGVAPRIPVPTPFCRKDTRFWSDSIICWQGYLGFNNLVVEKINLSGTRQDRGFDVEWNRRTGNKLELGRQFGRVSGSLFMSPKSDKAVGLSVKCISEDTEPHFNGFRLPSRWGVSVSNSERKTLGGFR